MRAYLIRRLLALIPTLFFASVIVFSTVRMIPGDIIDMMISQNDISAGKADRAQLEATLGLDQPMYIQYFRWVGGILQGDFGSSLWQEQSVIGEIGARLPTTFQLGFMALFVALIVAVPIGVWSAIRQDTWGDYLGRSFSILMLAVPGFWLGTIVMVFPAIWWGISPDVKFVPFSEDPLGNILQLALPAAILGTSLSAITMRMTRTMMLEVLRQDYIRTAWAKGMSEKTMVIRHALRNALIPVVTLIGLQAAYLLGGAVVTETMFSWPGVGRLAVGAIISSDFPTAQGAIMILALAFLMINLIVDVFYVYLDPRMQRG
jgi:peptide/nickel transport system permease protein